VSACASVIRETTMMTTLSKRSSLMTCAAEDTQMGRADLPPHRLAAICQKGGAAGQDRSELSDGTKPDKAWRQTGRSGPSTASAVARLANARLFFVILRHPLDWRVRPSLRFLSVIWHSGAGTSAVTETVETII
jgi:hypothetical protein